MRCLVVLSMLALCLASAFAQKIRLGNCPEVSVKANFDVNKYTGVWYEIEKNPTTFQAGKKCASAVYENKGDYLSVLNSGIDERTGEKSSVQGKATIPDKNVPAKLKVRIGNSPYDGDYWVLDTDYDNYSIVYSCINILDAFKADYLWILSRQKTLDDATKHQLYKFLDDQGIKRDALVASKQDC